MTTLSVLICTYHRHEMLARALEALVAGTTEKPDQVVVANGGDERADAVVRRFQGRTDPDVLLVKTVNKNLAASRNVGLPYCTGDIVAMTDDDAEVFPDWVTRLKQVHAEHPEAGAVGGAVIGARSTESLLSQLADLATFPSPAEPGYVRTLPGVNVSYKRAVIDRLGRQDETLFRGEDVDYNWRLQKLGYRVYYTPEIKVLHYHRPNWRKFLQQHYMYGRAYYLVRRKWPDLYCVYPHRFRSFRDILKLGYFFVAILYQPAQMAGRMTRATDRPAAFALFVLNQLAWKWGMAYQSLLEQSAKRST